MNVQATAKAGRIPTSAVTGLIVDAMMKSGVPAGDAAKIAELMLEADLTGADAHGVFRLPQYVQRLKLGSTNARPNITVTRSAPATALVDGDNGMGHLVVARTAETAIELARECGVAWVGCRMSGHAGAAGVYAAPTPTTCRSPAAPSRCSAPIRWRSRSRPAKSRRWCSISRPRSCPTAPSRITKCSTDRCTPTG
jgi:hypothetical protein